MKKSRRTYNGVHLNKKSNTQDVVEQSLTLYHYQHIPVYPYSDVTPYTARHSFGTLMLSSGIPIESIAKMMGHTNINSTQVYA